MVGGGGGREVFGLILFLFFGLEFGVILEFMDSCFY